MSISPRRRDGRADIAAGVLAGVLLSGLLSRGWTEVLVVAMTAVLLAEKTTQWGAEGA